MNRKLLIISNNCLSYENSNGRTLANLISGIPPSNLAQFYIKDEVPSLNICEHYYRVTDKQAFLSVFTGKVNGNISFSQNQRKDENSHISVSKIKNSLTMLIRSVVWNIGCWKGSDFRSWISHFNPNLILLQAGDSAFILKIALDISKGRNIPLLVYNSEGYYFKKRNYFSSSILSKFFYPFFILNLRNHIKKTFSSASHIIYSCEPLKNDFDKIIKTPSTVIYTASTIKTQNSNPRKSEDNQLKISYLGNLGLNRHESLIDLANELNKIDSRLKVDVYGKCPNSNVLKNLQDCYSINYNGFIDYSQVLKVIENSDVLLHVENFSSFYEDDLKYAFTTKIADSLSSGKCFLMYAPASLACSQYMISNKLFGIATSKTELGSKLIKILQDDNTRIECSTRGIQVANQNHSLNVVSNRFLFIINSL